jgi:hypothetical protein
MRCSVEPAQHRAFMHGDVIGCVALNLELRLIFARAMRVAFVDRISRVDLDYSTGYIPCLGIPADVSADFEEFDHVPFSRKRMMARQYRTMRRSNIFPHQ